MPIYLYSKAVFSWGFSVRIPGTSAGGESLPIPPPSTLVGAVAYNLARLQGWGETIQVATPRAGRRGSRGQVASSTYRLARHLLAAGARLVGLDGGMVYVSRFRDITKYQTTPYQSPSNLRDPAQWFGAVNFGSSMAPSAVLEYVLVFSDSVLMEIGNLEALEAAAIGVTRIGAREGIASGLEAWTGRARQEGEGETRLYAPIQSLERPRAGMPVIMVGDPRDPKLYMPSPPGSVQGLMLALVGARGAWSPGTMIYDPRYRARIRSGWTCYHGDWPGELGCVASLPPHGGGGW